MQREFILPPEDIEFLDAESYEWETIRDNKANWLIVKNFTLPDGYDHSIVSMALRIEPTYPDTQIDMMYFLPALQRTDGHKIGALSNQAIRADTWQRWSRHRTGQNPWRPGVDNVSTHFHLVKYLLESEFEK